MAMKPSKGDPLSPIRVMVVDDHAVVRGGLSTFLLAYDDLMLVGEAANGAEAIKVLESHDVQALFTDINMPVMTGTELLRAIASDPRWTNLLRVIISTDGSEARRHEVADLNVRLYVEKPFRPEVMRDVLSTISATNPVAQ